MGKMTTRIIVLGLFVIGILTFILGLIFHELIFHVLGVILNLFGAVYVLVDFLGNILFVKGEYDRRNVWISEAKKKGIFYVRALIKLRLRILERRLRKLAKEVQKYADSPQDLKEETLRRCHLSVVPLGLAGAFGFTATVLQLIIRPTEASTQGVRVLITWMNCITYFWLLFGALEGYSLWRLHVRVNSCNDDKVKWETEQTMLKIRQKAKA